MTEVGEQEGDRSFHPSGFFLLRSPLLPFDELRAWSQGLRAVDTLGDPGSLPEALAADRALLRERLGALMNRPLWREAVFLASPRVSEALSLWQKEPDSEAGQQLEPVLVSYLSRACARPTPFGLFAGCTTGTIGESTELRLNSRQRYRRHSRIGREYLSALAEALARDPRHRRSLTYRPNASLYDLAGRLRFTEARPLATGRAYHLVALEKTPHLTATLQRAAGGATWQALAEPLVNSQITPADADRFVTELVDSQILVADITPAVTGVEPGPGLVGALAERPETVPLGKRLGAAQAVLGDIDASGLVSAPDRYLAMASLLEGMAVTPGLSPLVEVDLLKPANLVLGAGLVREIERGVGILWRLQPPPPPDGLSQFREDFERRYGSREVPLVEALDEELGIGFEASGAPGAAAEPLLAALQLPDRSSRAGRHEAGEAGDWTERDALLLEKLLAALDEGATEIVLVPSDIGALSAEKPDPLPDAFHVLAAVAAVSPQAAAAGDVRVYLDHVRGPSGARLLGRFCHSDAVLCDLVRTHLRAEESHQPDAVFAEVVHLPGGRAGSLRPVLRGHEIPYLGRSGAPIADQIPVTDLAVSIQDGRIVLRSRRLDREVIPRLTSAHSYASRGVRMYRFLGQLGDQGVVPHLFWDWGALSNAPFLPRVTVGRAVLSRARWHLSQAERQLLCRTGGAIHFAAVQAWRERRRVPRYLALAEGDNQLLCDLDNVLSVEALARQLRKTTAAALVEFFPGPDELCVHGPEGRFVGEMVVPFVRTPAPDPDPQPQPHKKPHQKPHQRTASVPRRFPPGSEWLYAKLYTGEATADRVLTETLGPLARAWITTGTADHWFFVREADPDPHLRLRVHGSPARLQAEALPALTSAVAALIETGQVWRLALDTYEREVERYGGGRGIELAEQIFAADSEAVTAILGGLSGDAGLEVRWRLALCGVERLLTDLGFDLDQKRSVTRVAREAYEAEFAAFGVPGSGEFRTALGRRFRTERAGLEALVTGEVIPPVLAAGIGALGHRSRRLRPLTAELRALSDRGLLLVTMSDLARSLAHMHVGRMLRSAVRAQEFVLYEFLDRLYGSQAARRARSR